MDDRILYLLPVAGAILLGVVSTRAKAGEGGQPPGGELPGGLQCTTSPQYILLGQDNRGNLIVTNNSGERLSIDLACTDCDTRLRIFDSSRCRGVNPGQYCTIPVNELTRWMNNCGSIEGMALRVSSDSGLLELPLFTGCICHGNVINQWSLSVLDSGICMGDHSMTVYRSINGEWCYSRDGFNLGCYSYPQYDNECGNVCLADLSCI